jgi:hypothetical protein
MMLSIFLALIRGQGQAKIFSAITSSISCPFSRFKTGLGYKDIESCFLHPSFDVVLYEFGVFDMFLTCVYVSVLRIADHLAVLLF